MGGYSEHILHTNKCFACFQKRQPLDWLTQPLKWLAEGGLVLIWIGVMQPLTGFALQSDQQHRLRDREQKSYQATGPVCMHPIAKSFRDIWLKKYRSQPISKQVPQSVMTLPLHPLSLSKCEFPSDHITLPLYSEFHVSSLFFIF